MKDIKAAIFDIGNVIISFDHMISCKKLARISGLSPAQVYDLIFGNSLVDEFERGKIRPEDFYKKICERLNINISFGEFYNMWGDIFYLNKGMDSIISGLKKQVKIFAMSNTDPLHIKFFKNKFDVFKNIEKFFLSFEIGSKKPEKKIYQEALSYVKFPAKKVLLVDDLKKNVDAFKKMGGNGIIFKGAISLSDELEKYNLKI
ncbi:MAG: HAD family hydrolase [Actinomycetota bacterium]